MAVHESQSRLWENQVARSPEFWKFWEPAYRETFDQQLSGVSSHDFYLAVNSVALNPIRVDSDEVTYNLHILLRFELEKALFDGSLAVSDLPEEWNRLSEQIVGLRPRNDSEEFCKTYTGPALHSGIFLVTVLVTYWLHSFGMPFWSKYLRSLKRWQRETFLPCWIGCEQTFTNMVVEGSLLSYLK